MTTIVKAVILGAALITGSSSLVHSQSTQPIDMFGKRFIPEGHSYDGSNRKLPPLNSNEDQTTNRADLFETEIYKAQRDRAFWDTWVNSTHGTYLDGQTRLTPDY
jgi:hypothetical protein